MKTVATSRPVHTLRPFRATRAGFTLLEIMLVVMIIAVLAGSAIYLLRGNLGVAQVEGRVRPDLQNILTQLQIYETLNGAPPSTEQGLAALVTMPGGDPQPRRWRQLMPQIPQDPWGMNYYYTYPTAHNSSAGYDVYSSGPNRIAGDADDIGSWQ